MKKEVELFDKRFVHFMWDDELEGKRGFLSSGIDTLIKMVNEDSDRTEIQKGCERDLPFCKHITVACRLAYYDPNYEIKLAYYKEGKQIQHRVKGFVDWEDYTNQNPCWDDEDREWRVKPEREKWIAFLARYQDGLALSCCDESYWETAKKFDRAKTKLFIGSKDEAKEWYNSRERFAEVIKGWEDGKELQFRPNDPHLSWQECQNPSWDSKLEYRVKPNEENWVVHLSRRSDKPFLTAEPECFWDMIESENYAKSKLFVGSKEQCIEWYRLRKKFTEVIKAWEDGKTIQYRRFNYYWVDDSNPNWRIDCEYRVKPDCPCEEGIDSKACAGCPQDEARKRERIEERASKFGEVCVHPEYDDEKCKKCNECIEGPDYRPFKDCDELVEFWSKHYQTGMRPANTMPSIWVFDTQMKSQDFIESFVGDGVIILNEKVDFKELLEIYQFLDGSPCGIKEE